MISTQAAVDGMARPTPRRTLSALIVSEDRRRYRRRLIRWAAALAMPLLVAVGWMVLRPRPVPLAARFRTAIVTRGDVLREVRATGHVEAVTTVQVGAEISGRIVTVEADYNDHVKEGQVLARFDRVSLEAQLAQTAATVAATRAALEQARTDRDRTARDLARVTQLYASRSLSEAERDNAAAAARLDEQRVTAAQAQLAAQQAALGVARNSLDHAIIHAPIDGVVITRSIDPGQTVASMLQTPVLFTVAADLRKMRVIAAVDEADIGELVRQQAAFFSVNAYPDRVFEGVVTEVRNSPVVVQDIVTYEAVIAVDNAELLLKPGMTASVRIRTATATGVLRVASGALRFTPPGYPPVDRPGAWLRDGAELRRVDVRPGVTDGEISEIAPGALDPGESVLSELTPEGRKAYGLAH
jgi:HlyD family secretion protein